MNNSIYYFAGYIDGDGHFRVRKYIQAGYSRFHCKIMITYTNKLPVDYFVRNFGGCISHKKGSGKNSSDVADWQITDASLEMFIRKFVNHLIVKKENAKIIIYTRETFSKRPYPRDKNFYSYYSQNTPIRLSNFLKLKALNKRVT